MTKTQGKMIKWTVLTGVLLVVIMILLSGCGIAVENTNSEIIDSPLLSCEFIGEVERYDEIYRCTVLDTGDICYVASVFQGGGISCNFSEKIGE